MTIRKVHYELEAKLKSQGAGFFLNQVTFLCLKVGQIIEVHVVGGTLLLSGKLYED